MEKLLLILKLLGVVSTAAFGILGILHDFRGGDGKLTKWGKASVIGALASLFLAGSAQLLENYLQARSARSTAEQSLQSTQRLERILSELNRTMQPIESVSVFVHDLGVPMDYLPLQNYKDRLNKGLEEYLKLPPDKRDQERGLAIPVVSTASGVEVPSIVSIHESSPLFPNHAEESFARSVLTVNIVELALFRVPIAATDFRPFSHGLGIDPDLRITCFNREALPIQKSFETQTFHLSGTLNSEREHWGNKSGKIAAIPDLAGSQLFIAFGPFGAGEENERFLELRRNMSLNIMNISFGNRSRWIKSSMLKKHVSADGVVFWEFVFPVNETELFPEE